MYSYKYNIYSLIPLTTSHHLTSTHSPTLTHSYSTLHYTTALSHRCTYPRCYGPASGHYDEMDYNRKIRSKKNYGLLVVNFCPLFLIYVGIMSMRLLVIYVAL